MRILHIDLGRELRGGQHQVLLLLKHLRDAGHACTLLARSQLLEHASRLRYDVRVASLVNLFRLSSAYDIVHAHDARAHTWAALASRKPFVVSRRVAFSIRRSPLSKLKYRRATRYLAVSNFVAGELRAGGVPPYKIDIVYDAVEAPDRIENWAAAAPVIALASHDPQKGRDLIERASEISHTPIKFSTDLPKDLAYASAFVYISRSEGFGSAALLAMIRGVPVIASHIDGMAEVFEDGISGLAVENKPPAIAQALQRLKTQPELAQALIQNARTRALKLFNPATLVENTLASYRRALDL